MDCGLARDLIYFFANFKFSLTRLSNLLNLGLVKLATKFRSVIYLLINFKI